MRLIAIPARYLVAVGCTAWIRVGFWCFSSLSTYACTKGVHLVSGWVHALRTSEIIPQQFRLKGRKNFA